jgi:hypothetical protein
MLRKLLLHSLLVVASASAANAQSIENATIEREEYAIYSAMIEDYVYEERSAMVIANPTFAWSAPFKPKDLQFRSTNLRELLPSATPPVVSQETVDDFLQRNKGNRWLTRKLEINRKYTLADFREIKKLVNWSDPTEQAWTPFRKEYPESYGFVSLSRVGFNRTMDEALVHIGWRCPSLCGHSSFLMLVKKDGIWQVVAEANRVIS